MESSGGKNLPTPIANSAVPLAWLESRSENQPGPDNIPATGSAHPVKAKRSDQPSACGAGQSHSGVGGYMRRGPAPAPCTVDSRAGIAERLDHCASCGLNLSGSNAGHIRREPDHTM